MLSQCIRVCFRWPDSLQDKLVQPNGAGRVSRVRTSRGMSKENFRFTMVIVVLLSRRYGYRVTMFVVKIFTTPRKGSSTAELTGLTEVRHVPCKLQAPRL